ncbi:tag-307, partial [Pristionchus pacificus]
ISKMRGRSRLLVLSRRLMDQSINRVLPSISSALPSSSSSLPTGSRGIHTTAPTLARFRTTTPAPLKEIGVVLPTIEGVYQPGQLFVHRLFAYKGIILCSFKTKVIEKTDDPKEPVIKRDETQYQVLIHRGDWASMGFPVDLTAYLAESNSYANRGEKVFTTMNGLDCVSHADILPFAGSERSPIDHDLFDRIFHSSEAASESQQAEAGGVPVVRYSIRNEIRPFYMSSTRSWMAPCHVNRETNEGIEVTVTTFYLGTTLSGGQPKHMWRYVMRLNNLTGSTVIVRERHLKVFSLNSMHQLNGHGVVGRQPELTAARPAFQFSSNVDLSQSKGGHMWGSFKMERENGQTFDVHIPAFQLDAPISDSPVPSSPSTPHPPHPSAPSPTPPIPTPE